MTKLYNSVGYLTTEDILLVSEKKNLTLEEVDILFERIISYGIVILDTAPDTIDESSIPVEDVVITISHRGYILRIPLASYNTQRRGGRGVSMIEARANGFVDQMYVNLSHDYLLFFTNHGRIHKIKTYEIPESRRLGKGKLINELLQLVPNETISHMIPISSMAVNEIMGRNLVFATRQGMVKRNALFDYLNIPKTGIKALSLRNDDELVSVCLTDGNQDIIMATHKGMSIRFSEADVRTMKRDTTGIIGIQLSENDWVVSMDTVSEKNSILDTILVITILGYGKKTSIHEYRKQVRGGKGFTSLNCTDKNGWVAGLRVVNEDKEILIVTKLGVTLRTSVAEIAEMGRNAQGVRLINLHEQDEVVAVTQVTRRQ
ncbi:DNA gyrase C-terminal beta-propeller domain-containing protein [Paenibacillus lemnae]|uniref:DNA gyrase C-terminal beta-propeller domain-containing protein n=1 Tax=Paenibacillus lemnae TaxID=1330551 RepID=UPI001B7D6F6E|nr:DNA gyrase C-terminal beta-propeller domain-containing protein [Paenibacillus lemnae]